MSATSGTFDSQLTAENSMFWAENQKKTKLKNTFSAENETGQNHHKSSFSALKTKPKFSRSLAAVILWWISLTQFDARAWGLERRQRPFPNQ